MTHKKGSINAKLLLLRRLGASGEEGYSLGILKNRIFFKKSFNLIFK
jgi:hypothetical protein